VSKAFNISHPLSDEPGMSQRRRLSPALDATQNLLDARDLADTLVYIHQFSKQVNFYDFTLEVSNWSVFFEKSPPFILARLARQNTEGSLFEFQQYNNLVKNDPTPANFQLLLDFIYCTTLLDVAALYADTKSVGGFRHALEQEISSREMTDAIRQFVGIANAAQYWLCGSRKDFSFLTEDDIWQLDITDIFAQSTPSVIGQKQLILAWQQGIERYFDHFSRVLSRLSVAAEAHLSESLYPLEVEFKERHEPHLGLLFAFLELFKYLKGQLNEVTARHLDFYFRQILKIQSRKAIPDAVHLVLEVQKHVQKQLLQKGIDFRDGKDGRGQDILFSLNDDIIVNKAQIKSLKTLFVKTHLAKPKSARPTSDTVEALNFTENAVNSSILTENSVENAAQTPICDPSAAILEPYTEGVFIAPVANSADGKGMDFKDPMSKNWATLGRDKSKFVPKIDDKNLIPDDNPFARLGFILASPVLFLQEGFRTITIDLTVSNTPQNFAKINDFFTLKLAPFKVYLSGEKEWISAKIDSLAVNNQSLKFIIKLDATVAPIVHFNAENLKENYGTTEPVVKIEIDQNVKISLFTEGYNPCCCAERVKSGGEIWVSVYHFLKNISVTDAKINVQVCGIKKNIVVQNDENLQDVNGLIYPFGTRPDVPDFTVVNGYTPSNRDGSNFYIGSKEIFLKKWQQVNIHLNWKDKPTDFENHYGAYLQRPPFPTNTKVNDFKTFGLDIDAFKVRMAYLSEGKWHRLAKEQPLFSDTPSDIQKNLVRQCGAKPSDFDQQLVVKTRQVKRFTYKIQNLKRWILVQKEAYFIPKHFGNLTDKPTKLNAETPNGFIRLTLHGQDFLHKDYPFVLARQMMAFGRLPNDTVTGAVYMIGNVPQVINFFQLLKDIQDLTARIGLMDSVPTAVRAFMVKINEIISRPLTGKSDWEKKFTEIKVLFAGATDENIQQEIATFFQDINNILTQVNTAQSAAEIKFNQIKTLFAGATDETIQQDLSNFLKKITDIIGNADAPTVKFNKIKTEFDSPEDDNLKINLADFFKQIRDVISANLTSKSGFEIKLDAIKALFSGAGQRDENIKANVKGFFKQITDIIDSNVVNEDPNKVKFDEIKTAFDDDKADEADKDKESIAEKVDALAQFAKDQKVILDRVIGVGVKKALIPNEPWTPILKNISLDYAAEAQSADIALIHIYPFEATYKTENIGAKSTLLPQFLDEGTLFLGFEQLEPSTIVQILFQLAEATADTEGGRAEVKWQYLSKNNEWKPLRTGFDILHDATNGLTASGIIKLAIPEDIGDKNIDNQSITQMQSGQYWLKVASAQNTRAVCETLGIFTQAVRATAQITEGTDTTRLNVPIAAKSVAKLAVADASIKQVMQPFESFGGQIEEAGNQFYLRVSERLRHKGRAAMPFDYERLLLEAFPNIYKAKCIPHNLALPANQYQVDLPKAAGFVTVAIIPDLTRLTSGDLTEPRVSLHVLDEITTYLKHRTTPFARLKVVNPRYEKVNMCFQLKLKKGKDRTYYPKQLETELRRFLAPWAVGDSDKLSFGQPIYYSDILTFIDQRDYVDYVKCLNVKLEESANCVERDPSVNEVEKGILRPLTPRSVLVAGAINIELLTDTCD
jgi:hypothetical protein